ncbi:MAG: hypothetical protein HKO94_03705, partial [Flavobacteriaceae bacterium]|nr:hypothetical protein [Flavobacteriaceae bacterium]
DKLGLHLEHSWDRNKNDKGALFRAGFGLIEVLQLPYEDRYKIQGLDYRKPQGAFMVIQVWNIDDLFKKYKAAGVSFKQEIVDQEWGHRTFSIIEPNGVTLLFIQDPFDSES